MLRLSVRVFVVAVDAAVVVALEGEEHAALLEGGPRAFPVVFESGKGPAADKVQVG